MGVKTPRTKKIVFLLVAAGKNEAALLLIFTKNPEFYPFFVRKNAIFCFYPLDNFIFMSYNLLCST